jgi:hypothetical protein
LTIDDDPLARWQTGSDDMFGLVASRFAQVQSRRRARLYLLVLLFGVQLKNSWTIAEQAGDLSPDGTQRLLNFSTWDADQVRDDSRATCWTGWASRRGWWWPTRPVSSKRAAAS